MLSYTYVRNIARGRPQKWQSQWKGAYFTKRWLLWPRCSAAGMVLRLRVAVLCLAAVCFSLDRPAAAAASVGAAATDPAAFYVDLDIRGTVNGLRRRKMGIVTLRFNPSWAPNGARRIRQVGTITACVCPVCALLLPLAAA